MSGNRWDQPGVPHKGWHCVDVVDLRADGESADETDYATCQMCGNEKIRYVHIMEHQLFKPQPAISYYAISVPSPIKNPDQ